MTSSQATELYQSWYTQFYTEDNDFVSYSSNIPNSSDTIFKFANLLHIKFESFAKDSTNLIADTKTTDQQFKERTTRFLNFLNTSSIVLQKLVTRIKSEDTLLFNRTKRLVDFLYDQIDRLRMRCLKLLKSKLGIKFQYLGIIRQVTKCVCL